MEVFTHDVKKIKGTANKNGLKNAVCKQSLISMSVRVNKAYLYYTIP